MTIHRLKSGFWVKSLLRRLNQTPDQDCNDAVLLKKGDDDAGILLVTLNSLGRPFAILREQGDAWHVHLTGQDGKFPHDSKMAEDNAFSYLERQKRYDPDLWIIEINSQFSSDSSDISPDSGKNNLTDYLARIEKRLGSRYGVADSPHKEKI